MENNKFTSFGFRKVVTSAKEALVSEVFSSVADKYDLMNDAMSFGLHRLWKRDLVKLAELQEGQHILDIASGTGDLPILFAPKIGNDGKIYVTDINQDMLNLAKQKLFNKGIARNIEFCIANTEELQFNDNKFDTITISFGLRNVTNKQKAISEMYRVLKPGGKLLIMEFSQVRSEILKKIYELYSFHVIPKIGKLITGDQDSYQYLVESIKMHPNQIELQNMVLQSGFQHCSHYNLLDGIVAIHLAKKTDENFNIAE